MKKFVLASGNAGKIKEFNHRLSSFGINVVPQSESNVPEVEETGLSFVENAIIKARNACLHTNLPALADDSGLEVDALNGAPGIYSARFSQTSKSKATDASNNEKLLRELSGLPKEKRTARFQCIIAYMRHAEDPTPIICQASWEGFIVESLSGSNGFGYDPLFYVPTHQCTSAELPPDVKNAISHRGQAMTQLQAYLSRTSS